MRDEMKMTGFSGHTAVILTAFFFAMGALAGSAPKKAPPAPAKVYASFLWAGKSDADCLLRDTILADTEAECKKEYTRAEADIKELVKRRNKRGAEWKWGVFSKCAAFASIDEYNKELEKLRKRCMGK